jgi:hypothetical protein
MEEEFLDVLQNIEVMITSYDQQNPGLTDYQVDSALEALGRTYMRERTGGAPVLPKNEQARGLYEAIKGISDWQLGKTSMVDEEGSPMTPRVITHDDMLACIKRLRKSVSTWNKNSGSRGYLEYVKQFQ